MRLLAPSLFPGAASCGHCSMLPPPLWDLSTQDSEHAASTLPDSPGSGQGLSGCDRSGLAWWLVCSSCLLQFSSVASVSSLPVLLASLCLGNFTSACGHLALVCTSTNLGQCFSFEHLPSTVSRTGLRLAPPLPIRTESPSKGDFSAQRLLCGGDLLVWCSLSLRGTGHWPEGRVSLINPVLLVAR